MATAPLVGAPAAPVEAAEPFRLVGWRRPALRALSIGLFLLAWHVATLWDLDLYVRFQNIPAPGDVLAEAIALFGSAGFYVHILASLERIWLGSYLSDEVLTDHSALEHADAGPKTVERVLRGQPAGPVQGKTAKHGA